MRKLSVAMCTYEGGAFVRPQLESIAAQTRRPDELIVCDDASTDATVSMVEAFAASAPFPVRLVRNPVRLGSTANFNQAIGLCRGELIALSDQDDVWRADKLELLAACFEQNGQLGFAVSDARIVDENLNFLGYRLWESLGLSKRERSDLENGAAVRVLLRRNVVTGAAMMFAARLRELILPIPAGWVHDGWIALMIAAVADSAVVPETLVDYRQHSGQQLGAPRYTLGRQMRTARRMDRDYFRLLAENWMAAGERLAGRADLRDPRIPRHIRAKAAHTMERCRMREGRPALARIAREAVAGRYGRYSLGWKSLAQDLFLR